MCKDSAGNLKCIELGEGPGLPGAFIHTCEFGCSRIRSAVLTVSVPNCGRPTPHVEAGVVSGQKSTFVVSFLEEQVVQTAQTLFSTQPHYTFGTEEGMADDGRDLACWLTVPSQIGPSFKKPCSGQSSCSWRALRKPPRKDAGKNVLARTSALCGRRMDGWPCFSLPTRNANHASNMYFYHVSRRGSPG